jgi:ParB family transcriptional regulator, chromosome partitioning protein
VPKAKGGLGRGLSALIPQSSAVEPEEAVSSSVPVADAPGGSPAVVATSTAGGLVNLPIASIEPNPRQPRQSFPVERLEELAESIRTHGIIQPLVVTAGSEGGRYHIVAGERRWRASMLAGLESVPAVVKEASPREMLELALVENIQRADLNPLEEAAAYRALVDEFGLKQEEVADRVGKSRAAVSNVMRLLSLPTLVQEALAGGLIKEGHARPLLQLEDERSQIWLLDQIIRNDLSVRQVEALARRLAASSVPPDEPKTNEPRPLFDEWKDLEERFIHALSAKVSLSKSRRGGKLTIYFSSDEELDRIYSTIVGEE